MTSGGLGNRNAVKIGDILLSVRFCQKQFFHERWNLFIHSNLAYCICHSIIFTKRLMETRFFSPHHPVDLEFYCKLSPKSKSSGFYFIQSTFLYLKTQLLFISISNIIMAPLWNLCALSLLQKAFAHPLANSVHEICIHVTRQNSNHYLLPSKDQLYWGNESFYKYIGMEYINSYLPSSLQLNLLS